MIVKEVFLYALNSLNNSNRPSAYAVIHLLDNEGNVLETKEQFISQGANVYRHISTEIEVVNRDAKFAVLYVANESRTDVYFDDLAIKHDRLVWQENSYYPFGMGIKPLDQEYEGAHRFTYNGKELEEETGWHEYGQRDYDAQLGRFHKVDRFAEKYINLTSYHYGANNPIKYVDVNGDSIMVNGYKYTQGHLYDKDGNEYTEGDDFLDQFITDMNVLESLDGEIGDKIRCMIEDLENGDVRLDIDESSSILGSLKNMWESGSGDMDHVRTSEVKGNHVNAVLPDKGISLQYSQVEPSKEKLDGISIQSHLTLVHELQHAHDIYSGKAKEIADNTSYNTSKLRFSMEARAMVTTNQVRQALDSNEMRTQYSGTTVLNNDNTIKPEYKND